MRLIPIEHSQRQSDRHCQQRHRSREFVKFLNHLEKHPPAEHEIHLITDTDAGGEWRVAHVNIGELHNIAACKSAFDARTPTRRCRRRRIHNIAGQVASAPILNTAMLCKAPMLMVLWCRSPVAEIAENKAHVVQIGLKRQ
jgi:hypothetical protein